MLHASSSVHLQLHGTVYACAVHVSYGIALLYAILSLTLLPLHKWISTHIALHLHGSSSCIPQLVYTDFIFHITDTTYLKANYFRYFVLGIVWA